jgi:hypothetical protein
MLIAAIRTHGAGVLGERAAGLRVWRFPPGTATAAASLSPAADPR